ncbi:hypothetical protein F5051DRAFT_453623 [Lentinula edodes]|nr:hypothetical protein F5051DRAFT_453623 [Lentinula edodes]
MASVDPPIPFEPRVNVDTPELNERLRSCYGLADTQLFEIKEMLRSSQMDIADYDSEIKRVKLAYDTETSRIHADYKMNAAVLRERYEAEVGRAQTAHSAKMHRIRLRCQGLKKHTEKLTTLLSPIRRIPSEILLRILVHFCDQNDLTSYEPGDASALTISAVCTRWRQLAMSQPALWANLKVKFDDQCEDDEEKTQALLVSRVELHLARSQNHPLTLSLFPLSSKNHPALVLVARESRRWRRLSYGGDDFGSNWNSCLQSLPLPMLEAVRFEETEYCDGQSPPIEAFSQAPNIKELDLRCIFIDQHVTAIFDGAWEMLTDLSYHFAEDLEGFLSILDCCPKLRRLTLEGENSDLIPVQPIRSHPISSLKILNLVNPPNDHDSMLECILTSLLLPDLTELVLLHIGDVEEPFLMPYRILEDFFQRSRCPLSTLTLGQICMTDTDMIALLAHLPCLRELTCEDPDDGDSFITRSFIRSLHTWERDSLHRSIEPLVPQLRSLTLKTHREEFDAPTFVETITSRWLPDEASATQLGASCLRSVELHLEGVVDADAYEPLKRFDRAGMRVVVKSKGLNGLVNLV